MHKSFFLSLCIAFFCTSLIHADCIIIYGSMDVQQSEGSVLFGCSFCEHIELKVMSLRRHFTFFFVPIFPIGMKRYFLSCPGCQNTYTHPDLVNLRIEDFIDRYKWKSSLLKLDANAA